LPKNSRGKTKNLNQASRKREQECVNEHCRLRITCGTGKTDHNFNWQNTASITSLKRTDHAHEETQEITKSHTEELKAETNWDKERGRGVKTHSRDDAPFFGQLKNTHGTKNKKHHAGRIDTIIRKGKSVKCYISSQGKKGVMELQKTNPQRKEQERVTSKRGHFCCRIRSRRNRIKRSSEGTGGKEGMRRTKFGRVESVC